VRAEVVVAAHKSLDENLDLAVATLDDAHGVVPPRWTNGELHSMRSDAAEERLPPKLRVGADRSWRAVNVYPVTFEGVCSRRQVSRFRANKFAEGGISVHDVEVAVLCTPRIEVQVVHLYFPPEVLGQDSTKGDLANRRARKRRASLRTGCACIDDLSEVLLHLWLVDAGALDDSTHLVDGRVRKMVQAHSELSRIGFCKTHGVQ
jgi:hypothetical protein